MPDEQESYLLVDHRIKFICNFNSTSALEINVETNRQELEEKITAKTFENIFRFLYLDVDFRGYPL